MHLAIPVATLALLLPVALPAQIIRGVVLEEGTTTVIASATVELLAPDSPLVATAVTNEKGWFNLEAKQEGRFRIRTAHPFYTAGRIDSVTVGRHETVTIVLRMARAPIPLAPLVVAARSHNPLQRFRVRSEAGRPGQFIGRDYIDRRIAQQPSALLRMTPGIRVIRTSTVPTRNAILMREAAGYCSPNIYLDGLPAMTDIDDLTSTAVIEGIEIYRPREPLPPEFLLPDNSCGTVAFWSRANARGHFQWKHVGIFAVFAGIMFVLTQ